MASKAPTLPARAGGRSFYLKVALALVAFTVAGFSIDLALGRAHASQSSQDRPYSTFDRNKLDRS